MLEKPLSVAIVGCGIGQSHLAAYQALPERFKVVALCDLNRELAERVAQEYEIPGVVTSFASLCEDIDIDVIDICTPSHLHHRQALQALGAGKHVVCEKPVAASLAQADELLEAERRSPGRLMPIFNYRFGSGLQLLRHLQQQGVAGEAFLATIETAWKRDASYYAVEWRGKWRSELGGALVTHAIHAHDMLYYILGPARSVFARTTTRVNPIETEDCAVVSLEMADGSLASLAVTLGSAEEITRQRYHFRNLTAESNRAPYAPNSSEPWAITTNDPDTERAVARAKSELPQLPEGFAGQFHRFHDALASGTELPVRLEDARRSIELITAIYASARSGRPVDLPLTADHPLYHGWLPVQQQEPSQQD